MPTSIGLANHLITLCASLISAHKHASFLNIVFNAETKWTGLEMQFLALYIYI